MCIRDSFKNISCTRSSACARLPRIRKARLKQGRPNIEYNAANACMSPACARASVIASTRCANPAAGSPVSFIAIRTIQSGRSLQAKDSAAGCGRLLVRQADFDDHRALHLQFGATARFVDAQRERRAIGTEPDDVAFDLLATGGQHAHETARIVVCRASFVAVSYTLLRAHET